MSPTDRPHRLPRPVLPGASILAALLFVWARRLAAPTPFLMWGVVLAVLFAGALTLTLLSWFGAVEVGGGARPVLATLLVSSTLFLVAHFAALFARQSDAARQLDIGRRVVAALERARAAGPLPPTLPAVAVDPRAVATLRYVRRTDRDYGLCFDGPGGVPNCYDSETGKWRLHQ